jgi:uncharacterized membrane protein YvbJ
MGQARTAMECPECGVIIPDKAISCPKCGYPIAEQKESLRFGKTKQYFQSKKQKQLFFAFYWMMLLFAFMLIVIGLSIASYVPAIFSAVIFIVILPIYHLTFRSHLKEQSSNYRNTINKGNR